MGQIQYYGITIEEDACLNCGQMGILTRAELQHQMSPYVVGSWSVANPDLILRWECTKCAIEWETSEVQGSVASRRRTQAWWGLSSGVPIAAPSIEPEPVHVPESIDPPRVITGSVLGYRAWRIVDWQLYGTGVDRAWVPGINEATCDTGRSGIAAFAAFGYEQSSHRAPAPGCHCGITALARFTENDEHWRNVDVFGAIEAWGENEVEVDVAKPGDVADATGINRPKCSLCLDVIPDGIVEPCPNCGRQPAPSEPEPSGFHLHRNGFRARYGKVVLLAIDDDWRPAKKAAVRALAREHEADVCKREHLEAAAIEHGQLVPDELLEWVAKTEPASQTLDQIYGYSSPMSYFVPSYFASSYAPTVNLYSSAPVFSSYTNAGKGAHQRWHVNRGIVKPGCPYCEPDDDDDDYDEDDD